MSPNVPESKMPGRKISAVAIAGSITTVLVFILTYAGVDLPPEVAAAVTTLVASVLGYLVPDNG